MEVLHLIDAEITKSVEVFGKNFLRPRPQLIIDLCQLDACAEGSVAREDSPFPAAVASTEHVERPEDVGGPPQLVSLNTNGAETHSGAEMTNAATSPNGCQGTMMTS